VINSPLSPDLLEQYKAAAAECAVSFVQSGMRVGLGSGSTAIYATRRIAELLRAGTLRDIMGFATSQATWDQAHRLAIPLITDDLASDLDITIDGADEVDPDLNVIKGGGGALLREKIVAQASRREIVVVDETKPSPRLGTRHALPVEVISFGWCAQARYLESLGATIHRRTKEDGAPFVTDSGNMILDCDFGPIESPGQLAEKLNRRAGVVEHGLFIGLVTDVIVAGANGVRHLKRSRCFS
jgi:ribose 5-phosphate isomerase A